MGKKIRNVLKVLSKENSEIFLKMNEKKVLNLKFKNKEILVDIFDFKTLLKHPSLIKMALDMRGSSKNYKIKIKGDSFKRLFSKKTKKK